MKNIIDIYESVLSRTKDRVSGVKNIVDKVTLKSLDHYKYANIFNPHVLEDTLFGLNVWKVTDKEYTYKVLNDLNLYNVPLDDDVVDFFYRLSQINNKHHIIAQWMYYYLDEKSVATTSPGVLKSAFKHGKIYKNYSAKQKEMRKRAVNFWNDIDDSEQYVAFYHDYDSYVWWVWIPKSLNADEKMFMESLMNLMVKYNK